MLVAPDETVAALDGATIVFVVSASPARGVWPREDEGSVPANLKRWERLARDIAEEHGVFVALVYVATGRFSYVAAGLVLFLTGAVLVEKMSLPRHSPDGQLVTAGGRVLAVTGQADTISEARERAYRGVAQIHFDGMQFRTDIAAHAVEGARA